MSADRPDPEEFVDDRHDGEEDPYGIVPEGFVQAWNATSIRDALRKAEQATGKTDPDEFPRCPECGTIRISRKPGTQNMPHKRSEAYKCPNGHHFDEPAPSREAMRDGEQATLRDMKRKASKQPNTPDRDLETFRVEVPTTPTVSEAECARWRRELRGARSLDDGIDDKRGQQTLKFHVRGQCECDTDEPALAYERSGPIGKWVSRE